MHVYLYVCSYFHFLRKVELSIPKKSFKAPPNFAFP